MNAHRIRARTAVNVRTASISLFVIAHPAMAESDASMTSTSVGRTRVSMAASVGTVLTRSRAHACPATKEPTARRTSTTASRILAEMMDRALIWLMGTNVFVCLRSLVVTVNQKWIRVRPE